MGYLAAKILTLYGRHFESAAMNSTCFQDAIGFIQIM